MNDHRNDGGAKYGDGAFYCLEPSLRSLGVNAMARSAHADLPLRISLVLRVCFPPGISDSGMLVGVNGTSAFRRSGSTQTPLTNLVTSGGSSAAYGVNPSGTSSTHYIVGQSVGGGNRPVAWVNGGAPVNLSGNQGNEYGIGAAYAVNDAGVVVGESAGFASAPGGAFITRPFRTATGAVALTANDYMDVPSAPDGDHSGRANAVATAIANNVSYHYAVGRFKVDTITTLKQAVFWSPSGNGLPGNPADLGSLKRNGSDDNQSEATGINNTLRIVGWSGASSTSSDRRAVFMPAYYAGPPPGSLWKDLNDKHFAYGSPAGWVMQAAAAVNSSGAIAGTGINNSGQPRGFILVPRSVGQ